MNKIEQIKPIKKARIGLYSVGLKAYWNQFEGLKERLIFSSRANILITKQTYPLSFEETSLDKSA
jgi:hypothetical protein